MFGRPLKKAAAHVALAVAVLALAACGAGKTVKVKPQPPPTWARAYGGEKNDQASMAIPVSGGGFVMVGRTFSKGAGGSDGWVVRMDRLGKVLWERTFGGKGMDTFKTVSPAPGGGFVVAGATTTNSKGRRDGWVIRLDAKGKKLWEKTFGGAHDDAINSSTPMPGGGTLMAGYTRSSGNGHRDAWFLWVGEDGKQSWERTAGGRKREEMSAIAAVPGGGFIAAGITRSFGAGGTDAWVHRLGKDGKETLWTRTFGDAAWNAIQAVAPVPGGGFILAGNTRSRKAGKVDVWVVRIDAQGKKLWERGIGGPRIDFATAVRPLENGGFLVGGATRSKGAGLFDAWLIGLDGQGRQVWERTFGKSGNDGFTKIIQAPDGGFIAAGYTAKPGKKEDFDGWVLLLDQDGKVRDKNAKKPIPASR
ncbi:MAG: hypothetical protein IIC64_01205 [SAR324 cluster bacterium]|nr:hypothetical protein [SAR324 cluster bacterium]